MAAGTFFVCCGRTKNQIMTQYCTFLEHHFPRQVNTFLSRPGLNSVLCFPTRNSHYVLQLECYVFSRDTGLLWWLRLFRVMAVARVLLGRHLNTVTIMMMIMIRDKATKMMMDAVQPCGVQNIFIINFPNSPQNTTDVRFLSIIFSKKVRNILNKSGDQGL